MSMNPYIKIELTNEILVTKNFISDCQQAARKDDGVISEEEQKILDKIAKSAKRFIKDLEKYRSELDEAK